TLHEDLPLTVALRLGGGIARDELVPLALELLAARHRGAKRLERLLRNVEEPVLRPAELPLGETDLLLAEGGAVRLGGVLLVWAAVADVGRDVDQRRAVGHGARGADRPLDGPEVVAGDVLYVPAVGLEPAAHVLGECEAGAALDGDPVVVVEVDQ